MKKIIGVVCPMGNVKVFRSEVEICIRQWKDILRL